MSCDSFKMLLSAYVDGEVDKNERVTIESHLATCQNCSAELDKFTRLKAFFSHLEIKEPAIGFRRRLSTRLMTAQHTKPLWSRLEIWVPYHFLRPLTYAFLFLIIIGGSSLVFFKYRSPELPVKVVLEQSSDTKLALNNESKDVVSSRNLDSLQEKMETSWDHVEEIYAEDILFESTRVSSEGEDLLSFNFETDPFEDLLEGTDLGG